MKGEGATVSARKTMTQRQTQEFQVVLLAGGKGNRLYPLTEGTSKYVLPVANRPLISFQLELLEKVGFNEVIVITDTDSAPVLKKYVGELKKGKMKVIFEINKARVGTAEALLKIRHLLTNNFIVMSGDLIVDEHFLHSMADIHRTQNATATILLRKKVNGEATEEIKKSKDIELGDFIGLNDEGRLVYFSPAADMEDELTIRKSILKRYLNITMHTDLIDAHFYIFSKWVLNILQGYQDKIVSIKGELIPFLVNLQKQKKLKKGIEDVIRPPTLADEMSSSKFGAHDNLGCFAFVMEDGICTRINTLQSYLDANREIPKGTTQYAPVEKMGKNNYIHESAVVDPKTQVGPECVVGEGSTIGEKCSIKKSNIGKHCKIGNSVKIINSVVMDHVTIQDNCTVQNSILCSNVHMASNCSVKDCQFGLSYSFETKSSFKNESLVAEDE